MFSLSFLDLVLTLAPTILVLFLNLSLILIRKKFQDLGWFIWMLLMNLMYLKEGQLLSREEPLLLSFPWVVMPNKLVESIFYKLERNSAALCLDSIGCFSGNLLGYVTGSRSCLKFLSHSVMKSKPLEGMSIKFIGSY